MTMRGMMKRRSVRAALVAGGAWIFAQTALAGDWIADTAAGCRVWNPHPQSGETVQWSGACVNGFAHGRGVAKWSRNNVPYETDEGEWHDGRQFGHGTQVWPAGSYDGELLDSEPAGRGKLTLQGVRYAGSFRNGKPNGPGILTNGSETYEGSWVEGCFRDATRKASFLVPLSTCR
jgi:hypothetical protein